MIRLTSRRVRNALLNKNLDPDDPVAISQFTKQELAYIPGVAKGSVGLIEEWLKGNGLALKINHKPRYCRTCGHELGS